MSKVDPRSFLLNTDYEMDKIVYFKEGTIDANTTANISHNLKFTPLVFGICAYNSDFSDPRALPYEDITPDNAIAFTINASNSRIQLGYGDYSDNPPKMYYRVYAFEPSDSRAKVGATSKYADALILNTDYNYCKLYKTGIANSGDVITHNFGYIPQVLAWREDNNGLVTPVENSLLNNPFGNVEYVRITSTGVTFTNTGKTHYRIYYDEV